MIWLEALGWTVCMGGMSWHYWRLKPTMDARPIKATPMIRVDIKALDGNRSWYQASFDTFGPSGKGPAIDMDTARALELAASRLRSEVEGYAAGVTRSS